ncbi:TetR/AcrR family transcriptional regulator C-terminal domain-containing protein [Brucella gallinifaecis]|uniref:TetR/AcrR family transcriptional regulator n=1 Tax=Brucella gallinifaecis TaxID=215590 RepID=A0A502BM80_9HYPH|nr:TetR/AcrR family transcriptional regulator [Brucella gallinifaecis]TPF74418.1 TetR/AcrR family transcriptional regulator [Brucella gallinifaecis]
MNREHGIKDGATNDQVETQSIKLSAGGELGAAEELSTEAGRIRLGAGQDPVKRQQILEGAQVVFLRMGFDAASMNDITREAGVSKGTIYVYFNSKEELFVALCEHYRRTMFSNLIDKLERGFSTRQELVEFGVALVTIITSSTALRAQRIIIGVSERKPELAAHFYERGPKRSLLIMADYLERMVKAGEIEPLDPMEKAQQLIDLFLAGLYRPRLFGAMPESPTDQVIVKNVESAVDFFFKAFGKKK